MPDNDATKKPSEKAVAPPSGTISFVAFDGSSSDANKKAVRKQAALASAAARKATIAKKVAKQKEQDQKQREKTRTIEEPANVKRKRALEGSWQSGVSIIPTKKTKEPVDYQRRDKSRPRIVTAYLDPPSSPDEKETDWPGWRRTSTEGAAASVLSTSTEVPSSYSRQIMPLRTTGWAVLSNDYEQIEQSQLPPTPESLASPGCSSASMMDPFSHYPVAYHPVYDRLLHHMMTIFAPRGWASLKINTTEGLAWERFMTQHALAEPALFLTWRAGQNVVVALRGLAIKAINEALTDNNRCISDGLILAVGRIAFAESLYGDKAAANHTHRPAQRRMIDLRGGMAALDFPPLVKRLMRMTDRIMSIQGGTARLLPDEEEAGHAAFDMKATVNVMEDWAPQEARAMRKKIAIADLIT
ncbi:hypothetical protein AMS68_007811 [Peltaster fructicola]|uniref:Uncharacterized protein n=1 Tax=Peltaster fructicola TaxID=286661 RepID=A0A6H0Y5K4_9PEZI|nr:hypothetical protein AMS68_007811 [Peltaster fructicola]